MHPVREKIAEAWNNDDNTTLLMVAEQIANEFYKLRNTNAKNVYKKDSKKTTFACIIKKDDYENEFDTCTKVLIT